MRLKDLSNWYYRRLWRGIIPALFHYRVKTQNRPLVFLVTVYPVVKYVQVQLRYFHCETPYTLSVDWNY